MRNENKNNINLPIQVQEAIEKGLSGKLNTLSIQFKGNTVHSIEMVKEEPLKKRMSDILNEDAYQTLEVKKHEGRVSYIRKSVKVKL